VIYKCIETAIHYSKFSEQIKCGRLT